MKDEVAQLQHAAQAVVRLLKNDTALDEKEEEIIACEVGRVRKQLSLWRDRKKSRKRSGGYAAIPRFTEGAD